GDDGAMDASLQKAREANPACALSSISWALRQAEVAAADSTGSSEASEALGKVREVLARINAQTSLQVEEALVGGSVPVTWTFLVDTYAYVLFKSGDRRLSRTLLRACLREDEDYSSSYLHLGEW